MKSTKIKIEFTYSELCHLCNSLWCIDNKDATCKLCESTGNKIDKAIKELEAKK